MKERPILFSGPMVRAILDGTKTQTRRVVKLPEDARDVRYWAPPSGKSQQGWADPGVNYWTASGNHLDACPYGQPGDRLWVRETLRTHNHHGFPLGKINQIESMAGRIWSYAADNISDPPQTGSRPSIHMPRWASRITLEVTGVRVERLQDISEADVMAEGIKRTPVGRLVTFEVPGTDIERLHPVVAYEALWNSINAKTAPWASNPWVWVISFVRVS